MSFGTRIQLSSGFPDSVSPVRACTITIPDIGEAEFVMNILLPFMIHSPFFSSAVVWVAPASLPALGSVSPNEARISPLHSLGSHSRFYSSLPK